MPCLAIDSGDTVVGVDVAISVCGFRVALGRPAAMHCEKINRICMVLCVTAIADGDGIKKTRSILVESRDKRFAGIHTGGKSVSVQEPVEAEPTVIGGYPVMPCCLCGCTHARVCVVAVSRLKSAA